MITTRIALLGFVARHNLDAATAAELWRIAGFDTQPKTLLFWLKRGFGITGAALGGLAILFGIAANWHLLTRYEQFGLLQAVVLASCVGAALIPAARTALGLLSVLSIGALFAYFGQTYQTGADPWQLFALWAVLSLPLGLTVRSDVVWSAWVVIAMVGIALWQETQIGQSWYLDDVSLMAQMTTSISATLLTSLFVKRLRGYTGAGPFAFGLALTLSCILITTCATFNLFKGPPLHYWLTLAMLGTCAKIFLSAGFYDIFAASVVSLALNFLLVAGLAEILVKRNSLLALLVLGLAAAGLLAVTVMIILAVSRKQVNDGRKA